MSNAEISQCSKCPRKYKSNQGLWRHYRKKHDPMFKVHQKRLELKYCFHCGFETRRKIALGRHIRREHRDLLMLKQTFSRILCAADIECDVPFDTYGSYVVHLQNYHGVPIDVEEFTFQTEEEFQGWKQIIYNAHYVKERAPYRCKDRSIEFLRCHRSYTPNITSGIRTKFKGSVKIGRACPSNIRVERTPGKIYVRFFKTHVGHQFELEKLPLAETCKKEIVEKLAAGNSFDEVLAEIKATADPLGEQQRIHLIRRADLHNITKEFKIDIKGIQKSKVEEDTNMAKMCDKILEQVQGLHHLVQQSNLRCCVYSDDRMNNLILRSDEDNVIYGMHDHTPDI